MFICTSNKTKCEELQEKGFRLLFKQFHGKEFVYTFEFKPSFFALFNEENRQDIYVSNKMNMT